MESQQIFLALSLQPRLQRRRPPLGQLVEIAYKLLNKIAQRDKIVAIELLNEIVL